MLSKLGFRVHGVGVVCTVPESQNRDPRIVLLVVNGGLVFGVSFLVRVRVESPPVHDVVRPEHCQERSDLLCYSAAASISARGSEYGLQ
jgi:hypothetical protein